VRREGGLVGGEVGSGGGGSDGGTNLEIGVLWAQGGGGDDIMEKRARPDPPPL